MPERKGNDPSGMMILRILIGAVVGGLLGFSHYRWIGCSSGTCPLLSNPYTSILYGMILGGVITANIR